MRLMPCILAALLAATAGAWPAFAGSVADRARRDEIVRVPTDDPDMAAAFATARAQLQDFLKLARVPRPGMSLFALKVRITDGKTAEYFWINPFVEKDDRFTGRLDNTPRLVRTVKSGQQITFSLDDVYDWLFMDRGRMQGNFTGCALLKREKPAEAEELRKQVGLTCDPDPLRNLAP